MKRSSVKTVQVGDVKLGGSHPVRVQSMCDTDTRDIKATVNQILQLEKAGCEIIRVAVPDMEAAKGIGKIKKQIHIPLVADIHFDYRLAIESINQGVDKVRINPGNIGSEEKVKAVVKACKENNVPIRIGVNGGSLEKELTEKYGHTPKAAVESALKHIRILEKLNFYEILVSIKFSEVKPMVESYRLLSQKVNYPLHLGITHAGTKTMGTVKNSIGIGMLLQENIGSTIRVSLTAPLEEEIRVGWNILEATGKRKKGPKLISCPTCGRTEIDMMSLTEKVEKALQEVKKPITVAVMGCVVNGPGEAKEADVGVAGGKSKGAIFSKGQVIKTVEEKDILPTLLEEIEKL
jgi:(E)-4-hydroxy-3-methylbut-2-enyl-diphosphate synthase